MLPNKVSWRALAVFTVVVSVCAHPHDGGDSPARRIIDQILSSGYPIEVHNVTTEDGYILGVHRIPYGKNGPTRERRPVVFVMHGLMSASSHFVNLGENSIAFNLADAGYDVWMGNARGNVYSRAHITLNPNDSIEKFEFFDFTWEEIGVIDLPAMIDYALAHTGERKLHYVGHSQGGTVFFVLNSMRPEYNEKFASAHLMAGVGYTANFPNRPLGAIAQSTTVIYALALNYGLVEIAINPPVSMSSDHMSLDHKPSDYCFGDVRNAAMCDLLGLDIILEDRSVVALEMGGSSVKQIAHFGQNVRDGAFRRWDYGLVSNMVHYGSINPPSYDLSRVTADVTMHYALADILLSEQDVLAMVDVMPNTVARKVARDTFRHVDFISSADVKPLVTDYIIEDLNKVEGKA